MKVKKKMIPILIAVTLAINSIGIFAGTVSSQKVWDQLSSSQQSKFEQAGMSLAILSKMEDKLTGIDISSIIDPAVTYEGNDFTVSQKNTEKALELISIYTGNDINKDSAMASFNDVIDDINHNSSDRTKKDFAQLLGSFGLCSQGGPGQVMPEDLAGGQGGVLTQANIQIQLEESLQALQESKKHTKEQEAGMQKILEVLSSHMIEPLSSVTKGDVEKTWGQSLHWQNENANKGEFNKAKAPVARWLMSGGEVTIPKDLWDNSSQYGRIELEAGSVVLSIGKNTYTSTSKVRIKPDNKAAYMQGVTISSTAKIYEPATIRFYINAEDAQDYGVYRLQGDQEQLVGGIYNKELGAVEALVKSSGTYALKKAPVKVYSDLTHVDWAKNEINHLGQKGYISGKAEGLYGPKDEITRAEFAVLLTRILQLPNSSIGHNFKDIKSNEWYYNDLMAAIEAQLFSGKSATTFDPNGKITRQEVAAVISRILIQKGYTEPKAEEVEKGIWAGNAIALVKEQSLTTKLPEFNEKVRGNANRAEVAYILYNLLQR